MSGELDQVNGLSTVATIRIFQTDHLMALIHVDRFLLHPDCTIGRVMVNDQFFCFSIEDEKRTTKVHGHTCIPDGIYPLGFRISPRFSKMYNHAMLWVQHVPDFEFVLIHWGNTVSDTEGCLIIGDKIGILNGKDAVLNSRSTYLKFYNLVAEEVKKGGQFIKYTSVAPVANPSVENRLASVN